MAEATAFDTHRFVKHPAARGFTGAQAEALKEAGINKKTP